MEPPPKPTTTIVVTGVAFFMALLDATIVTVASPTVQHEFRLDLQQPLSLPQASRSGCRLPGCPAAEPEPSAHGRR
jgi:hypothetical protein